MCTVAGAGLWLSCPTGERDRDGGRGGEVGDVKTETKVWDGDVGVRVGRKGGNGH